MLNGAQRKSNGAQGGLKGAQDCSNGDQRGSMGLKEALKGSKGLKVTAKPMCNRSAHRIWVRYSKIYSKRKKFKYDE